jgi:hypothetical protein
MGMEGFIPAAMASWRHLQSLFIKEMHWPGIVYRVGWRGRVTGVCSDREPAGAND